MRIETISEILFGDIRQHGAHRNNIMLTKMEQNEGEKMTLMDKPTTANNIGRLTIGQQIKVVYIKPRYFFHQDKAHTKLFKRTLRYKHSLALIFLFLLVFLTTSFAYLFFNSHALPRTKLGNNDISFWSRGKINEYANSMSSAYSISVEGESGRAEANLDELGIYILPNETAKNIFSQQNKNLLSRLKLFSSKNYEFKITIDDTKLNKYLELQKTTLKAAGHNATVTIENGNVVIVPETNQEEIKFNDPVQKIYQSTKKAEPLILEMEKVVTQPQITSEKLTPLRDHIQGIINTDISLNLNGTIIATTKEQRGSWLTIKSDSTDTAGVTVDVVKVEGYLDGTIRPYIKPPRSRVVVASSDGSTKELVSGENGVTVTDKPKVISELSSKLSSKQEAIIKVPVSYTERNTITAADYPKWIQVDLTNKRMYAYERGNLVNQFLVSAGAPETPTVVGQYAIKTKLRVQTMRGLNADGSRYVQPDVEWVNYFYEDYAIHGNYWRPKSVFGNINTSHGCVGLVNAEAEWIYNWAPVGTPVITHY
jgi:lipoprotein-anchoring transpeptidase ErfK/SrfK